MDLRTIISNPNSVEFREKYLCLGNRNGKKQLRTDCQRLNIRIPLKGLQLIESGFSTTEKVSWANNIFRSDYDIGSIGRGGGSIDSGPLGKRINKGKKNENGLDAWGRTLPKVKRTPEEIEAEEKEKKIKIKADALKDKMDKEKQHKEKKWKKTIKKCEKLDSWEDF
jgi:hypothetical protein